MKKTVQYGKRIIDLDFKKIQYIFQSGEKQTIQADLNI